MNVLGIPSVDSVLHEPALAALLAELPRGLVVACVRECVAAVRRERLAAAPAGVAAPGETATQVAAMAAERLAAQRRRSLRRVVNATGVVVHTNLGRSVLGPGALAALREVAAAYCNLETDVATGARWTRESHVAGLLCQLTGAEAATTANNNAAATFLALTALASGRRVICSRGELVEIGGSFRMPDVVACSGAQMVEVGTTNRTHLGDYEAALTDGTAAILKTHRSNFSIVGFTSEVAVRPLAELAHRRGAVLVFDAGSGLLLSGGEPVFAREPVIRQAITDGADVVTFSTDKLLGGPQGGAIVGRRALIERIGGHPLKRAVRLGKLTLAALEATLHAHLRPDGVPDTVTMRLILRPVGELEAEAEALRRRVHEAAPAWALAVEPDDSSIGGGSMPGETVPTVVLWLDAMGLDAAALDEAFRRNEPPIFGRFRRSRFGLDLRTLLPGDAGDIAACCARLASKAGP